MNPPRTSPIDPVLAQAPYVRALARRLVFDAHLARDVEQETLLAALEHGPRDPGALRGWLAALVRNFAVKAWRSSSRREKREHAAARPESSVPSPSEILAREDRRRELVEQVLALDESLRAVLVLRFLEELPPRAVARRLALPVETVRSRTRRGLELLRERLDRESDGDRGAWCLALVRGFGLRASLPRVVAGLLQTFQSGVITMSLAHKVTVSAALLALFTSGVLLWRHSTRNEAAPSLARMESGASESVRSPPEALAHGEAAHSGESTVREPLTPIALREGPVATTGSLFLRVAWHDGTPAQCVRVFLVSDEFASLPTQQGTTTSDGTCAFEELAPRRVRVLLDRNLDVNVEVHAGERVERTLTIARGSDVQGVVVEVDGTPVAGAEVCADVLGNGAAFVLALTNREGRFSVRSVCSSRSSYIHARAPLHAPTPRCKLDGGFEHSHDVRLVFPARGGGLEGTVRDAQGGPIESAWVQVDAGDGTSEIPSSDESGGLPTVLCLASTDVDGRFRISGLAQRRLDVRVRAAGLGPWEGALEIVEGRDTQLDVTLFEGTTLAGTVTDPAGRPVAGVVVGTHHERGILRRACRSHDDGSYLLDGLPAREFAVAAVLSEVELDSTRVTGFSGLRFRWDPVVDRGLTIRGRVVVPGMDPNRFFVEFSTVAADGRQVVGSVTTEDDGRFELPRCLDLPYELRVASAEQPMMPMRVLTDVRPGADVLVIEIEPSRLATARLKGRVLDSAGLTIAFAGVSPQCEGLETGLVFQTRADGTFDLGPFPPGRWRVVVMERRTPTVLLRSRAVDVGPGECVDLGDLRPGP